VKFFKVSAWLSNHTVCKIGLRAELEKLRIREARKVVVAHGPLKPTRQRELMFCLVLFKIPTIGYILYDGMLLSAWL
jgi:hypothetical protein